MRIRGALVQYLLALQFQLLPSPLLIGFSRSSLPVGVRCALAVTLPVGNLLLDGFTFPASRHTLMLKPILDHPKDIHRADSDCRILW